VWGSFSDRAAARSDHRSEVRGDAPHLLAVWLDPDQLSASPRHHFSAVQPGRPL